MPHLGRTAILVGLVLVIYGVGSSWFVALIAYGGILHESGVVQAIVFGPLAVVVLGGATLAAFGFYRMVCRRPTSN